MPDNKQMLDVKNVPLSLYIHIPWCEKKCPYCDFNSHENQLHFDEDKYVKALIDDLDQDLVDFDISNRVIQSIFIGGGTPSLFSGKAYKKLFTEIAKRLPIDNAEITLEANPGSSEREKFSAYREAGINRLSIGIQSFNADALKRIGRVHNEGDASIAAQAASKAGFDNFNLDIMFALPEQSTEQAIWDIETAISHKPSHLSCYQLTLEPNTLFYKQPPKLPSTDRAWEMQGEIQKLLAAANYQQYEVSAYAQPKKQCQHNLNYWQFGDYLAIGAGAHGKITTSDGIIKRYWKQKQPKTYIDTSTTNKRLGEVKTIPSNDLPFEFMLNALRLRHGFKLSDFTQFTGLEHTVIEATLNQHIQQNLMINENGQFKPSEQGFSFIDSMLNDYLTE